MFRFVDLMERMAEAREEGYGHAYLTVDPDTEEVSWGYCGDKFVPPERRGMVTTWVSPLVIGEKSEAQRRRDGRAWLEEIKAGLGIEVFSRLYEPAVGRPALYPERKRTTVELSYEMRAALNALRGNKGMGSYIEEVLARDPAIREFLASSKNSPEKA